MLNHLQFSQIFRSQKTKVRDHIFYIIVHIQKIHIKQKHTEAYFHNIKHYAFFK